MTFLEIIQAQFEEFEAKYEESAPEHMAGWLMVTGREGTELFAPFRKFFESEMGSSLRDILNEIVSLLEKEIGKAQIISVLEEEPRDNRILKQELYALVSLTSIAVSNRITADFE